MSRPLLYLFWCMCKRIHMHCMLFRMRFSNIPFLRRWLEHEINTGKEGAKQPGTSEVLKGLTKKLPNLLFLSNRVEYWPA